MHGDFSCPNGFLPAITGFNCVAGFGGSTGDHVGRSPNDRGNVANAAFFVTSAPSVPDVPDAASDTEPPHGSVLDLMRCDVVCLALSSGNVAAATSVTEADVTWAALCVRDVGSTVVDLAGAASVLDPALNVDSNLSGLAELFTAVEDLNVDVKVEEVALRSANGEPLDVEMATLLLFQFSP